MLKDVIAADAAAIRACLEREIPADTPLSAAISHALFGGKALRGFLVLETARLHEVDPRRAIYPAAAIEAMHAYSLVHDDLPCMDDDDLRRGQPTVHVKWDEGTAVLAGDALQSLAFELALHPDGAQSDTARANLGLGLAKSAGIRGMVLGQALDIAAETAKMPLTIEAIIDLQAGKTGALFGWAATAGAVMAEADSKPLTAYANALGLAFQIQDDIIDETGDAAAVGKAVGKDAAAGKATFVSLLGLKEAKHRASNLVEIACNSLSVYGQRGDRLRDLARFVISRQS